MFMDRGRIVLNCTMEEFELRYVEVMVHPGQVSAAQALQPIYQREVFGRSLLLFDLGVNLNQNQNLDNVRQQLAALGEVRTPSIADLFVAVVGNRSPTQGAAQGSLAQGQGSPQ
jgi:ABC-2 type transport system ATP-binding protein